TSVNSHRIIPAALRATFAGCASLPPPAARLEAQVAAELERRGLGAEALLVIDNLVRNGPPAPRATPALVRELFARPLDALDAGAVFQRAVPAALAGFAPGAPQPFAALLKAYAEELARAQHALQGATRPFDEELILRQVRQGLPAPDGLLALADALDADRLREANRLFIDATARFARSLSRLELPEGRVFELGFGRVVVGTRGNDVHQLAPARGGRVSVLIDPGGDDEYRGSDLALHGFSAIIDLAGDDRYTMDGAGLGAALAGASLLIDFAGNDSYQAKFFAQGAAAFGFGALLDLGGDDRYRVEAWGQGFGIGDGVGLLWDRAGNDRYLAGGVPDRFNRAGGLSGAQGAAFGHRGQLAGGIGILRDDAGDDAYEAQMFAQGLGYYYGLGVLWERGGNDRYRALQYAQGNGVHQALGVLREESGDDRYDLAVIYGQGMGHDVAFGALVDHAGNDDYRAHDAAQGAATANGIGLLADRSGADRFTTAHGIHKWGYAEWRRGLPTVAVLLHGTGAQFTPPFPGERPLAVEPTSPIVCPSRDPGEALVCRLRDAANADAAWRELRALVDTPLAGWVAIALRERPPAREQAEEIAALLAAREGCNVRALALRAWPTLPAAEAALRSSCFRLQSAGVAAYARLGVALPADAPLPTFLRRIPSQEDTY
ncbi:MAG TPA: hypothetical protein VFZ54_19820, partial [Burkholderiales bacterium]